MSINIAINGFGRIGRNVVRALYENARNHDFKLVAINELADPEGIAHLLKYDSTHGRFSFAVQQDGDTLFIAGDEVALSHEANISNLPWQQHNVDIVIDCTGIFGTQADGQAHIEQGAKKVLFRTLEHKT